MLTIKNLLVRYGAFAALQNVSLSISEGQVVSIVGANGAGKTTLINSISRLLEPASGEIIFEGKDLMRIEGHDVAGMGIAQVPEGRQLFPDMTVQENLWMGGYSKHAKPERQKNLAYVFSLFPILKDRARQSARTLSGGEQQMLAIGRAVMMNPRLIMFDEPSLGLAPKVVKSILDTIVQLKASGMTIMLVEQNVRQSLQISDYAYVLETGHVTLEGTGSAVLEDEHTRKAYLGV
jgi:branched-chain amino acid transport system ATP-binding protein